MSTMSRVVSKQPRATKSLRIRLTLDFDGTLTKRDTMHVVAEAGYARQRRFQRDPPPRPWSEIVDAYISDFKAHAEAYRPRTADRHTYEQELAWLNSLRTIENASINRAVKAGIFDNLSTMDMATAADKALNDGQVRFRDGWAKLIMFVGEHNTHVELSDPQDRPVQVISVNWSASFVRAILQGCLEREPSPEQKLSWWKDIPVHANELPAVNETDFLGKSSSQIPAEQQHRKSIRTSGDKVEMLNSIYNNTQAGKDYILIFVGDSSTDLESLLAADTGICIRDEPMGSGQKELAATCKRLGIKVLHISEQKVTCSPSSNKQSHGLFWVRDFSEIHEWLERTLSVPSI